MSKVLPFNIPKPDNSGLIFQIDEGKRFFDKLHQHEEIQLSYIKRGSGTLIVGDAVNSYEEGDVLVIGSHVPHVFKSFENRTASSYMMTIFFTRDSFGANFFDLDIMKHISTFFERSKHGIKLKSNTIMLANMFHDMQDDIPFGRFVLLLRMLELISKSDYESLSSFVLNRQYRDIDGMRMRRVFEFTLNNYTKDISLDDVSEVAHMTKNAFCKYFKKRTNKTYITFLNELRVKHACRHLSTSRDYTIAEIAYMSGFGNISNFNRVFKQLVGLVPSTYARKTESKRLVID